MHIPVLLDEVIEFLNLKSGQKFIDATINGGGHALAILEKIKPDGKLLGVEWDSELYKNLKSKVENLELNQDVILVNDSYANLKTIAEESGFMEADGIFFDLGLSSWHLEESGRGFSFQKDEPLNMRFAPYLEAPAPKRLSYAAGSNLTAEQIINQFREEELAKIIKEYGEERFAKSIARKVVQERKKKPIKRTLELVKIIKNAVPFWYRGRGRIHFATRTFQAIRIAANNELENIETGLRQAEDVLKKGGKLAVISFHSLEDRIVKNFFNEQSRGGRLKKITKKPVRAGLAELEKNPRARSAKLRVAEKIKD